MYVDDKCRIRYGPGRFAPHSPTDGTRAHPQQCFQAEPPCPTAATVYQGLPHGHAPTVAPTRPQDHVLPARPSAGLRLHLQCHVAQLQGLVLLRKRLRGREGWR